jgi:hypothetical protein
MMRFTPDGFISENSPEWVWLRERRDGEVGPGLWVAFSPSRLNYALWTNEPPAALR